MFYSFISLIHFSKKENEKKKVIEYLATEMKIIRACLVNYFSSLNFHHSLLITHNSSFITHHSIFHTRLAPSPNFHHSIFFTLFVGPYMLVGVTFSLFFLSFGEFGYWKKKKKKKKPRTEDRSSEKKKVKRWSKVAAVGPSMCVYLRKCH